MGEEEREYREISPEELEEILEKHKLWIETERKEGKHADLSRATLKYVNLSGAILKDANLIGAKLGEADLSWANLESADLSGAELRFADLNGAVLKFASLNGAKLLLADLRGANLENAELRVAHLGYANLTGANLGYADLSRATLYGITLLKTCVNQSNFTDADLDGAVFHATEDKKEDEAPPANIREYVEQESKKRVTTGAKLEPVVEGDFARAKLTGASFRNCDMSKGVRNIYAEQLAGTDLSGAKLPGHVDVYSDLEYVIKAASNERRTYIGLLVACVYSLIALASAKGPDTMLGLPLIDTRVPFEWFYSMAPLVLFTAFMYTQLKLHNIWEMISKLPAIFPDGKPLHRKAYPWMLIGMVRTRVKRLKYAETWRPIYSLRNFMSGMVVYGVTPLTLLYFWYAQRDWPGIADKVSLALFVASTLFALVSYGMAVSMLERWGLKELGEMNKDLKTAFGKWYIRERGKWGKWLKDVRKSFRGEEEDEED